MAYATTAQFVHNAGFALRVVDENIGTGNSSETNFDLDHGNVFAGTYTLSAATAGSNTFTALTETTDYALDKESGRIILTSAGVTALGTKILYGTYWYSDDFNNDDVEDMLDSATDEVDLLTGRRWTTATSATQYLDGKRTSTYPTTDEPFMEDWDHPDFIVLKNYPITKVDFVYFLNPAEAISKFYNYDDSGTTYTDKTSAVNSSTELPFTLFAAVPAANDIIYIGASSRFLGLQTNLSTVGTGSPVLDWEYYTTSGWTDLTESDIDTNASTFKASGKFIWSYPYGWSTTSVNGHSAYWIRAKVTTGYTIAPIIATMAITDPLNTIIEPRDYNFKSNGELTVYSNCVPNGVQNIRVDYYYGYATTPTYIVDLTTYVAAIKAYVRLSGGSYDDATSYTLGSKSVTIGEVYVNIREVINQFEKRVEDLLNKVGRRCDVVAI